MNTVVQKCKKDFTTLNQEINEIETQLEIVVTYNDDQLIEPIENPNDVEYKIYQVLPEKSVTVCLHINAKSTSEFEIDWFKGIKRIEFGPDSPYHHINNTCFNIIKTKIVTDSDEYYCLTAVVKGSATERVNCILHIKDVPQKPRTTSLRCEESEAILFWKNNSVTDIADDRFHFSDDFNYTVEYKIYEKGWETDELNHDGRLKNANTSFNDWTVYETAIKSTNFDLERYKLKLVKQINAQHKKKYFSKFSDRRFE